MLNVSNLPTVTRSGEPKSQSGGPLTVPQAKNSEVEPQFGTKAHAGVAHPTVQTAKALPMHFKALAGPQLRFGHQLTEDDYVITHRLRMPVNAYAASKTLRAMMLRDLIKREQGDTSTLKYALSAYANMGYPVDDAALADNAVLLDRDMDNVISGHSGPASTLTLMMNRIMNGTGRVYISQDSHLSLGPQSLAAGGKNHEQQVRRELGMEAIRSKESLIMLATGETDREKIYRELSGSRKYDFNALEALAYGKKGLVDAVMVGNKHVLTREKLDEYYASRKMGPDDIEKFNANALNLDKIPKRFLTSLDEYSPEAVVSPDVLADQTRPSNYFTANDAKNTQLTNESDMQLTKANTMNSLRLQIFARLMDDSDFKGMLGLPFLNARVSATPDMPTHIQLKGATLPPDDLGLIYDDMIFFNDGFDDDTGEQIATAMDSLKKKKAGQQDPSNIKILINSPGGSVFTARELRSKMAHLDKDKHKVDVIVTGMAASAGSWLLSSATGNRLATPNAMVMIHQAASVSQGPLEQANNGFDGTDASTREYASVVADASGRSLDAVRKDFRQDTWMNVLEAMFYGKKGLLDGIMVSANRAVTKDDILHYLKTDRQVQADLTQRFGTDDPDQNVEKYLNFRLKRLREPNTIHNPGQWERELAWDPFENPVRTIMMAAQNAERLQDIPGLKGSASRSQDVLDQFTIGRTPSMRDYDGAAADGEMSPEKPRQPGQYELGPDSQGPMMRI